MAVSISWGSFCQCRRPYNERPTMKGPYYSALSLRSERLSARLAGPPVSGNCHIGCYSQNLERRWFWALQVRGFRLGREGAGSKRRQVKGPIAVVSGPVNLFSVGLRLMTKVAHMWQGTVPHASVDPLDQSFVGFKALPKSHRI